MVQAIAIASSSAAVSYGAAKASPVALQAQLQRYQQQLSDCVNCASADTPKGKSDIEAIAARITQVQQRIAQADGANTTTNAPLASVAAGGRIDVFA
ncbi:hypothetical protein [Massilia genomosp. 1]|uniref:Uncharacterized protein n=1 Tax=Massilia genomosp. 1 TaxID=2609280 RepID=A0ABX0MUJ8_9BURK|nr:hypothetical protein [Massilia genomosp. 1]NHZ66436.1 hypothetical protein [Massilia genomosp. 1]